MMKSEQRPNKSPAIPLKDIEKINWLGNDKLMLDVRIEGSIQTKELQSEHWFLKFIVEEVLKLNPMP